MAAEDKNRARDQAQAQLDSVIRMVEALETADYHKREEAEQEIHEDPLEVCVRSAWYHPGMGRARASEYLIQLCTGGPAVRIIGDLDEHGEPETASIEYQDWFTPWEPFPLEGDQAQALLTYAGCFCFR